MSEIGRDINKAVRFLKRGDLVGIPTETVYGLACNALDTDAVLKIFEVKNRPSFDPLIVHIPNIARLDKLVYDLPENAEILAAAFWPGPLTLLLQKQECIPDVVTSGLSSVAIRIPDHPMALELLKALDFPLAAPSANPFGYVSPTLAQHVEDQLGERIPYVLDGGPCRIGIESTIIGFHKGKTIIHRLGGMTLENIEDIVGPVEVSKQSTSRPSAPGMLESHYAPRQQVFLGSWVQYSDKLTPESVAMIRFKEPDPEFDMSRQMILSETGDLHEAAKNLFSTLRYFDKSSINYIIAELMPEKGLGRAINDRLRRAAATKSS